MSHKNNLEALREQFKNKNYPAKLQAAFMNAEKLRSKTNLEDNLVIDEKEIDYVLELYNYGEQKAQEVKRLTAEIEQRDALIQELSDKLTAITKFLQDKKQEVAKNDGQATVVPASSAA